MVVERATLATEGTRTATRLGLLPLGQWVALLDTARARGAHSVVDGEGMALRHRLEAKAHALEPEPEPQLELGPWVDVARRLLAAHHMDSSPRHPLDMEAIRNQPLLCLPLVQALRA